MPPFGVLQSPKTQQVFTQMENPKFKAFESSSGVPVGHSYFPGNDEAQVKNEQLSLEQARYM